jgi:uncharacterized protein (DUF1499 family)
VYVYVCICVCVCVERLIYTYNSYPFVQTQDDTNERNNPGMTTTTRLQRCIHSDNCVNQQARDQASEEAVNK